MSHSASDVIVIYKRIKQIIDYFQTGNYAPKSVMFTLSFGKAKFEATFVNKKTDYYTIIPPDSVFHSGGMRVPGYGCAVNTADKHSYTKVLVAISEFYLDCLRLRRSIMNLVSEESDANILMDFNAIDATDIDNKKTIAYGDFTSLSTYSFITFSVPFDVESISNTIKIEFTDD